MRLRLRSLIPSLSAVLACSASAAVIGTTNYEGPPDFANGYNYVYAYDYAGYGNGGPNQDLGGNAVNSTGEFTLGVGVGGSGGFRIMADSSAVPAFGQPYPTPADPAVQYSYWGMGGGSGLAILQTPDSGNLADYKLTLDLRGFGMLGSTATVEFNLEFQVPDDFLGPDGDTNGDLILNAQFTTGGGDALIVSGNFATFEVMLDSFSSIGGGSLALFQQHVMQITNINVNFAVNNGGGEFGLDANNGIVVDNLRLEQVPEPSAALSLVLAGAGLIARRRRMN